MTIVTLTQVCLIWIHGKDALEALEHVNSSTVEVHVYTLKLRFSGPDSGGWPTIQCMLSPIGVNCPDRSIFALNEYGVFNTYPEIFRRDAIPQFRFPFKRKSARNSALQKCMDIMQNSQRYSSYSLLTHRRHFSPNPSSLSGLRTSAAHRRELAPVGKS